MMDTSSFMQQVIEVTVSGLVEFSAAWLIPVMVGAFVFTVLARVLVYYTVKRHDWFAVEFDKRVNRYMESVDPKEHRSFYVIVKRLLEKTFYEIFEVRERLKRRRPDKVMSMSDRVFLIRQGSAWLVRDTLKRIKHLRHTDHNPNLLQISKNLFQKNPCFNKVFGIIPLSGLNDVLNILPGIFIIGGIFGTFLGIMSALPELGAMDLSNTEQTNTVMTEFLVDISFAMSTSILGILLSVTTTFTNTVLSPEKVFMNVVEKYENSMDTLWHLSDSNDLPSHLPDFDENRDPLEALAEAALKEELDRHMSKSEKEQRVAGPKKAS